METLIQDIRYGVRMLKKSPLFTAVVILTLAIGIGANTALFSVVDAVLLRSLPYSNPRQLVAIHDDEPGASLPDVGMSVQERDDFQERSGVFDEVSGLVPIDVNVTGREKPERVEGMAVSNNYFTLLGVNPELGRVFTTADYRPGFSETVVISDGLWRRMFGADPAVLGRAIRLDSDLYTIVGVMPPEFRHPGRTLRKDVDVWVTSGFVAPPHPMPPRREIRMFPDAIARLKPGYTIEQAQAKLDSFVAGLRQQYPTAYPETARWTVRLAPLQDEVVGKSGTMLWVLLSAVAMVLLIACVNIASLLLARSSSRHREIAVRQALGAGSGRLLRQVLTESVLLSLCGGVLAVLLSVALKNLLLQLLPSSLPRLQEVSLNPRVLLLAIGISFVAGLAFGLAPALQLSDSRLMDELKHGTRGGGMSSRRHGFLRSLVVCEFSLSLVLLVGAGLLLRSFWNVLKVSPGFQTDHVVMAHIWLPVPNDPKLNPYLDQHKLTSFVREVTRRVEVLPGVQRAAIGSGSTPFSGQTGLTNFNIEGMAYGSGESPAAAMGSLTPDFSRTLGLTVVRGRSFADADNDSGAPVVLIDQTAAETYWPNQDPIGKKIQLNIPGAGNPFPWETIVGVVGKNKSEGLDAPYEPHIFFSAYQTVNFAMIVYVRTADSAESLQESIRRAVQSVDPNLPVFGVRAMDSVVSESLAARRFALLLMGMFAATALLLAGIGIYGVMAYVVSQRVREIGIRMALGAQREDVLRMVVSQGLLLAMAGVVLGALASLGVTGLISGLLFGVSAHDPLTLIAFTVVLASVALAANYIPARRAAKVDPMVALRYE